MEGSDHSSAAAPERTTETSVTRYVHKDDPGLPKARQEAAWASFLQALAEFTPELIDGLKGAPLEAFRDVADEYKKLSPYDFGSSLYISDGRQNLNPRPLGNLALSICSADGEVKWNDWPPSAPFREPAMRRSVSKLSTAMRDWARNFIAIDGNPHFGLVNAALQTMHHWLVQPESMEPMVWSGHARVSIFRLNPIPEYEFKLAGWNPRLETEKQYLARFNLEIKEVKRLVRAHLREMKGQLVKPDIKRNPEHYQWTALRLARRMTYSEITELCVAKNPKNVDDATVPKGVKTALKALGLRDVTTSGHSSD